MPSLDSLEMPKPVRTLRDRFVDFSKVTSGIVGSHWAFLVAIIVILAWAGSGPIFHYSDTWQLVINTSTTIVTFLMVFLIQSTQNRDAKAIHLKLDELIRAMRGARDDLVLLENMSEDELERLASEFEKLHDRACDRAKTREDKRDRQPAHVKATRPSRRVPRGPARRFGVAIAAGGREIPRPSMSEIPKTYEPQAIEEKWYALLAATIAASSLMPTSAKPAYSIVIPPPNVTGVLTLGHVLNNTIQDILARRARMLGKEVLWLPGTDHAGIATQNVVERTLKKQGAIKHRDDLGREKFVEKIWEWKEKHGGIIIQQLKKLGASCDWIARALHDGRGVLDAACSEVFVDLYKKGLIYRGKRMVNWCPASLTALSDEEVVMKQQNGTLYYFKVEVAEEPGTWLHHRHDAPGDHSRATPASR